VEPLHLSPADTGQSALADSIRAIQIAVAGTNGLDGDRERIVQVVRSIGLPNVVRPQLFTCGSPPLFGDTLLAIADTLPTGEPVVALQWGAAIDELGGEADVVRYVLWRRLNGSADWG